jgi:hypothetical protein
VLHVRILKWCERSAHAAFEPFGVQGVKINLEHDFGCGAIDYRGAYLNAGS